MTELFFQQQILNKKYLFTFAKKAITKQIQQNTKLNKAIEYFNPVDFLDDGFKIQIYKKNINREIVHSFDDIGKKKKVVTDVMLYAKVEFGELVGEVKVCEFFSAYCAALDSIKPPLICNLPRGLPVKKKREQERQKLERKENE